MTIAINARLLIPGQLEGIGRFTYETSRRMAEAHPVHQFVLFFDRPFSAEWIFSKNVMPVVLFPPARHPLLFILWFEWAITRALKKYKADVFLSADGFLSLSTRVKTVLVVHDLAWLHYPHFIGWEPRAYYRYFTPLFLKRADKVVAVSEYSRQDILSRYPLKNPDISVVYNGAREGFYPLDAEAQTRVRNIYTGGALYFLCVGSIHPRKNIVRLIEAFGLYREKMNDKGVHPSSETSSQTPLFPIKLVLAGRMGWQTDEVKNACDSSEYKKDIVFTGYVKEEELPALTASAFALMYVSLFEGFGVPILEAMQCEAPSIVSNTSSMPEVAGGAALLIDPLSASDIADAMFSLSIEPGLYHRLIEKGREQREKFSWSTSAAQLWSIVEQTAGDKSKPAT